MEVWSRLTAAWSNLLEGVIEAILWAAPRIRRRPSRSARVTDQGIVFVDSQGGELAKLGFDGRCEPQDFLAGLAGSIIAIEVPSAWVIRRNLPSTPKDSIAFLPAFVAYQIERITPWRAADVAFKIETSSIPEDPARWRIDVAVIPKHRIARALETLLARQPAKLLLNAAADDIHAGVSVEIDNFQQVSRHAVLRRRVALGIGLSTALFVAAVVFLYWQGIEVSNEIANLDQQIAAKKAAILHLRQDASDQSGERDPAAGGNHPMRVQILDDLASALPDDAYLTDLTIHADRLQIAGTARNTADLVPALEQSHHFADVTYSDATTRIEGGVGDEFHLDMRVVSEPEVKPQP